MGVYSCKGDWQVMTDDKRKPLWKWICLGCGVRVIREAGEDNKPVGCETLKVNNIMVGLSTRPGKAQGRSRGKYKKKIAGVTYEEGLL